MYALAAIFAVLFAVHAPAKPVKAAAPVAPRVAVPAPATQAPILIDSRFRRGETSPWDKKDDPAVFLPSARTC